MGETQQKLFWKIILARSTKIRRESEDSGTILKRFLRILKSLEKHLLRVVLWGAEEKTNVRMPRTEI